MHKMALMILLGMLCVACAPQPEDRPRPQEAPSALALPGAQAPMRPIGSAAGQTIYVPVYSHIYYHDDRRTVKLAATLSIRNTDARRPIAITALRYYDTNGTLVRRYVDVEEPLVLAPMASKDFVVEQKDTSGGSGANFIVTWRAEQVVSAPVVEAVMISTTMGQGISFVSTGRVIEDAKPEPAG